MRRYLPLLVGSLAWVALDQWTKHLAVRAFSLTDGRLPAEAHQIRTDVYAVTESWFNLRLAGNTGAAFSIFGDLSPGVRAIIFSVVTVVAVVAITYMWGRTQLKLQQAGFILLMGGAIGNAIDRVRLGYVVDFIQWYYKGFVWPTFNIADVGICVGIGLMFVDAWVNRAHHAEAEAARKAKSSEEASAA